MSVKIIQWKLKHKSKVLKEEESIEKIQISDSMFFLEGYIPKKCEEYLSNKLSSNKELYIEYSVQAIIIYVYTFTFKWWGVSDLKLY